MGDFLKDGAGFERAGGSLTNLEEALALDRQEPLALQATGVLNGGDDAIGDFACRPQVALGVGIGIAGKEVNVPMNVPPLNRA